MKTFLTFLSAMTLGVMAAQAQVEAPALDGYYRICCPAFDDVLSASGRHTLQLGEASATSADNVAYVKADELYSIIPEMEQLQDMAAAGLISGTDFVNQLQLLQNLNAWKSGQYAVKELRIQGVDYAAMAKRLGDYADDAIEDFLNNDIEALWQEHYADFMGMAIFTGIIMPADYESPATLRRWAENYLSQWRSYADFGLYLSPQMALPEGADDNTPLVHTGNYYISFRTPIWVGNLKKGQQWFNSWKQSMDGPEAEQLDVWGSTKKRILQAIAVDYPEGTPAYSFVRSLLGDVEADMVYAIGENEDGELYCQPQPDTFGENGITLTMEDILKCTWAFVPVTADCPVIVADSEAETADYAYSTLYTDFAYELSGATAYYATAVDGATGEPTLVEIVGGKVPAATPVILRRAAEAPCLVVPTTEAVPAVVGNVLSGTCHALTTEQPVVVFGGANLEPVFGHRTDAVAPNTAYFAGEVTGAGIHAVNQAAATRIFDLQGRPVERVAAPGLYIVNGQKMLR